MGRSSSGGDGLWGGRKQDMLSVDARRGARGLFRSLVLEVERWKWGKRREGLLGDETCEMESL